MARKLFHHRFTVQGSYRFPIDMLRYDACYPASEADAYKVDTAITGHSLGHHSESTSSSDGTIELSYLGPKTRLPTAGRWESFGWRVTSHTVGSEVAL